MRLHWESWLLRAGLLATLAFQLATQNKDGAMVAGEGFVVSLLTLAVEKLSKTHVPRPLEFAFVLGMALQFFSESTKLFEVFYYWDKVVHPTLIALSAMIAAWLLLAYRDTFHKRLPLHLSAAFGMLFGLSLGAFWEFVEFTADWFGNTDLQKSNADTISDIIANNIGAFVATLFGLWLYTHVIRSDERNAMGRIAAWIGHGPRVLLARHGRVLGAAVLLAVAGLGVASQVVDQGTPALASNLAPGGGGDWQFTSGAADTTPLSGDWVPDQRGICRVNLEHPKPGSEKMGLLELGPASAYGSDQPVSIEAHYFEERPPKTEGSEMDAGIAFGIRGPNDFYLLEESALHDILRLDRYVHGKRRDVREKLVRTHGNEWHTLGLSLSGDTASASIDGVAQYSVSGLADVAGGVGLWGRTAAATCFSEATLTVGGS